MTLPKRQSKKFWPGLGVEHVVTLDGVGIHTVVATIAVDTVITNANLVALPPNVVNLPANVVVHSLATTPSAVIPMTVGAAAGTRAGPFDVQLITADNSAIYVRAWSHTAGVFLASAFRFVIIR